MSTTTDIRKGDLVKATLKEQPENVATFRVAYVHSTHVESRENGFYRSTHDFEVLERPIEEELLKGALRAYKAARERGQSLTHWHEDAYYTGSLKAVIEFVRAYDKEHSK